MVLWLHYNSIFKYTEEALEIKMYYTMTIFLLMLHTSRCMCIYNSGLLISFETK